MAHKCHAIACEVEIPPRLLFCLKHWHLVPGPLQSEIWRTYRKGQEIDKDPSSEYLEAQKAAIEAVAAAEGRR